MGWTERHGFQAGRGIPDLVAVAKADTLAIGEPQSKSLISCDPGSEADIPLAEHRQKAVLAFKYTVGPEGKAAEAPWSLTLPVSVEPIPREAPIPAEPFLPDEESYDKTLTTD